MSETTATIILITGVACFIWLVICLIQSKRTKPVSVQFEDEFTITRWANETFGRSSNLNVAKRARKELDELIEKLEINEYSSEAEMELADVYIVLARLDTQISRDIWQAIDKKMRINRARRWVTDGTGNGQHV